MEVKPALIPSLGSTGERSNLRFNLSHTLGAALIGVALGRELGIDIERQRPLDDLDTMARSVMSAVELAQWQILEPGDRSRAFYHVWTRKESYLKAIGLGLYHSLQEVTVPVSVNSLDSSSGDFGIVQDRTREDIWSVTDIPVPEVYSASICCEGAEMPAIVVRELDIGSAL
jgi:4'-phosphopantetheinyl transferase